MTGGLHVRIATQSDGARRSTEHRLAPPERAIASAKLNWFRLANTRRHFGPLTAGVLFFAMSRPAGGQSPAAALPQVAPVAIVNVNLIRMEDDRVETGQTVIVSGDRIAGVGASSDLR